MRKSYIVSYKGPNQGQEIDAKLQLVEAVGFTVFIEENSTNLFKIESQ